MQQEVKMMNLGEDMLGLRCMNPVRGQSWRKLWEPLACGRWHGVRALG